MFSMRGKYKWIDILASATNDYNNRKHRTIGMRPSEVTAGTTLKAYTHVKLFNKAHRFKVDMKGDPVLGGFYEPELQKAKHPDLYLVEKVIRRKKNKVYVKWLGLDEKSWIDKDNIVL
ncbi:hypothetical protein RI129_000159 [Pyrocoelia pectoralis]|uniref:Chromo domain-containing protein n=1 Tax=Pyrocoelia pectoralis TaxID=417401 RepID=A0AAN7ZFP4_9COLE